MKTHLCKMALSKKIESMGAVTSPKASSEALGLALFGMGLLCISGFCFMCTSIMYVAWDFYFSKCREFSGCVPEDEKKKKKKKKYIFFLLLEINDICKIDFSLMNFSIWRGCFWCGSF